MDMTFLHAIMAVIALLSAGLIVLGGRTAFGTGYRRWTLALLAALGIAATPASRLVYPRSSPGELYTQCLVLATAWLICILLAGAWWRRRNAADAALRAPQGSLEGRDRATVTTRPQPDPAFSGPAFSASALSDPAFTDSAFSDSAPPDPDPSSTRDDPRLPTRAVHIDADRYEGDAEDNARRLATLNTSLDALTEQLQQATPLPASLSPAPLTGLALSIGNHQHKAANEDCGAALEHDADLPDGALWLHDFDWEEDFPTAIDEPLLIDAATSPVAETGHIVGGIDGETNVSETPVSGTSVSETIDSDGICCDGFGGETIDSDEIASEGIANEGITSEETERQAAGQRAIQREPVADAVDTPERSEHLARLPATLQEALRQNLTTAAGIELCLDRLEAALAAHADLEQQGMQQRDLLALRQADLSVAQQQELDAGRQLRASADRLIERQRRLLLKSRVRLGQLQKTLQEQQQDMDRARRMARQAAELARRAATAQQETRTLALREQQARLRSQESARRAMTIARNAISALAEKERTQSPPHTVPPPQRH